MSKELIPMGQNIPAPRNLDEVQRLAKLMVASNFFKGTQDLAKAAVKIMAGQELGFSPVQSLMGIHFVNDRLTYEAALMASALKRRGYDYRPITLTDSEVAIEFFNYKGASIGKSKFTIQDATRAGLTGKANWKNYPRNMLWARAMSNGCRWFCADVFGGLVYTPEEMGADIDESGKVIVEESQSKDKAQALTEQLIAKSEAPATPPQEMTEANPLEGRSLSNGGTWPATPELSPDFDRELEV